jgi:hypothetical protein
MAFNLSWIKEHKGIVAGVVLGAVLLIYIAKKSGGSSSDSGVAGALQSQQAGQLQMAQLNAQLSAQGQQTQAQLEAEQISTNAQSQSSQDQAAEQIALYGLQGSLYNNQLNAEVSEQQSLEPLEQQILSVSPSSLYGHTAEQQTLENELALLLTRGQVAGNLPATYAPGSGGSGSGFTLNIPGLGNLGVGGL